MQRHRVLATPVSSSGRPHLGIQGGNIDGTAVVNLCAYAHTCVRTHFEWTPTYVYWLLNMCEYMCWCAPTQHRYTQRSNPCTNQWLSSYATKCVLCGNSLIQWPVRRGCWYKHRRDAWWCDVRASVSVKYRPALLWSHGTTISISAVGCWVKHHYHIVLNTASSRRHLYNHRQHTDSPGASSSLACKYR